MKRRIDFYNISKRLNPRVHELDGKNVIRALSSLERVGSQHRRTPDEIFTSILVSQNGKKYFRFFSRFRWFWTTFNFAGKKFSEIFPSVCRGPDRCADGVALLPGNSRGGGGFFRFLPVATKPGDLAVCLYYNILLLFERRIDLYEISKRLKPRVHELDTDLD